MPTLSDCMKGSALLAGLAVTLLGIHGALAQSVTDSRLCAARDLEVVVLIEEHGAANDIVSERLAKAAMTQMEARAACSNGRAAEGVALYDDIIRGLDAMFSRSTQ
jgi:hypothetical protein